MRSGLRRSEAQKGVGRRWSGGGPGRKEKRGTGGDAVAPGRSGGGGSETGSVGARVDSDATHLLQPLLFLPVCVYLLRLLPGRAFGAARLASLSATAVQRCRLTGRKKREAGGKDDVEWLRGDTVYFFLATLFYFLSE